MIYRIAVFTVSLACIALYANAEEQILFVSDRDGNSEIYRYFPGGRPKRLTFDEGPDGNPALSPSGKSMAYVTTINRVSQIAVLDFNSRKPRQLTFSPKNDVHPTWSPDGKTIAYTSAVAFENTRIHLMTDKGVYLKQFREDGDGSDTNPDWFDPTAWSVSPATNFVTIWGEIKKPASAPR